MVARVRITIEGRSWTGIDDPDAHLTYKLLEFAMRHFEHNDGVRFPTGYAERTAGRLRQAATIYSEQLASSGNGTPELPDDGDPVTLSEKLTTRQAAAMAGVSERAIRRAFQEGRLLGRRYGKALVFGKEDVDEYRARRRNAA